MALEIHLLFSFTTKTFYQTWLYIWVRGVSDKKQELLTIGEYLSSPPVFSVVRVADRFSFLMLSYYVSLRSEFRVVVLWFPHEDDVRFVFAASCL